MTLWSSWTGRPARDSLRCQPTATRRYPGVPLGALAIITARPASPQDVEVWDISTGKKVVWHCYSAEAHSLWSLAWSPDGSRLALGEGGGLVTVWNTATAKRLLVLPDRAGEMEVSTVAWSPDGRRLASGSWETKTLTIWDTRYGKATPRPARPRRWNGGFHRCLEPGRQAFGFGRQFWPKECWPKDSHGMGYIRWARNAGTGWPHAIRELCGLDPRRKTPRDGRRG